MCKFKISELTTESFKEFGTLIDLNNQKADHEDIEFNWSENLTKLNPEDTLNNLRCKKRDVILSKMERHNETTELAFPLDGDVLITVAKPGPLTEENINIFRLKQGQGVLYNKNVWHYIPFPIKNDVNCLITFKKDTGANDLIFESLPKEIKLV